MLSPVWCFLSLSVRLFCVVVVVVVLGVFVCPFLVGCFSVWFVFLLGAFLFCWVFVFLLGACLLAFLLLGVVRVWCLVVGCFLSVGCLFVSGVFVVGCFCCRVIYLSGAFCWSGAFIGRVRFFSHVYIHKPARTFHKLTGTFPKLAGTFHTVAGQIPQAHVHVHNAP